MQQALKQIFQYPVKMKYVTNTAITFRVQKHQNLLVSLLMAQYTRY